MPNFSLIFIVSCFVIMMVFWIATAFSTKKTVQKSGGPLLRVIFYGLIILTIYLQTNVDFWAFSLWPRTLVIKIVADVVTLIGLLIMIWARVTLGKNWSANVVLKENQELVTTGPYAYVRHPIYSGLILMMLSWILYIDTLAFTVFFIIFFVGAYYKAKKEEKLLLTYFPETYPAYTKRVKALIPFIF
jgi:protein-S-isoprenylcysteine O-methyltransferase Ste14